MTLKLEVSPDTARRVERAISQGANIDTLICVALEHWIGSTDQNDPSTSRSIAHLVGSHEGEAWDDLLQEIEASRQQEAAFDMKRK